MTTEGTQTRQKPSRFWVVMEGKLGSRIVWAWGLVTTGPGFDEVYFTETDGHTPADISEVPQIVKHLFTVQGR